MINARTLTVPRFQMTLVRLGILLTVLLFTERILAHQPPSFPGTNQQQVHHQGHAQHVQHQGQQQQQQQQGQHQQQGQQQYQQEQPGGQPQQPGFGGEQVKDEGYCFM